jgi:lipid-binding SYLF domain-containing protein
MRYAHVKPLLCTVLTVAILCAGPIPASADSAWKIGSDAQRVLQKLYAQSPSAKALGERARGILVFPAITKGGLVVGGQYGEGALIQQGKVAGYYNTVSVSYGRQIGIQKYGYAMFFMTDAALDHLNRSDGWELGAGPSVVVVDKGMARGISTTTAKSDVYAFYFSQTGLMAGLGIQGTKITKIYK